MELESCRAAEDEGDGFLKQLKDLTDGFVRLKNDKDFMSKMVTEHEKKIKELETESEKKTSELKALRDERRELLNDLERSRYEVVKLTEENVALRRELEKQKNKSKRSEKKSTEKDKSTEAAVSDLVQGLEPTVNTSDQTEERVEVNISTIDMASPRPQADLEGVNSDFTDRPLPRKKPQHASRSSIRRNKLASQTKAQVESQAIVGDTHNTSPDRQLQGNSKQPETRNNTESPHKQPIVASQGLVVVYKPPEKENVGYKTSIPIEVLQKTIDPSLDKETPGQAGDTSGGNPELVADTISVQVEEIIASNSNLNTSVNEETVITEKETSALDCSLNSTGQIEKPDITDSLVNNERSNTDIIPESKTKKTSKKGSGKRKPKKDSLPVPEVEKSQTQNNSSSAKQGHKDLNNLENENLISNVESQGTEKETFLSNVNLSSTKSDSDVNSPQKENMGYETRSGKKRKLNAPVTASELLIASQKKIPSEIQTPSKIKKEKYASTSKQEKSGMKKKENISPKAKSSKKDNSVKKDGMTSVKKSHIDPATDEDLAGVYFCSPCNLGFKSEAIFDRHILFRHSGAGLICQLEPGSQPSIANAGPENENVQAVSSEQTGLLSSTLEVAQGDENNQPEPVSSEQTACQNGEAAPAQAKKRKVVLPKLRKETLTPSPVIKKEPKAGPPILTKECIDPGDAKPDKKLTNIKRHACTLCGKTFSAPVNLAAHMNMHNGIRPYECPQCQLRFYNKADRNKHVKVTHNSVKSFICTVCGKGFTTNSYLNHHLITHTQERKFGCSECGKRFRQKPHLDKHVSLIHKNERTHMCDICGKSFGTIYSLKNHKTTHTNVKIFSCDICGKNFGNKSYLLKHQRYHTGDKKYMCIYCKKLFYLSTDLQRHMLIHTNTKPYSCELCEYKSMMKSNMKVHMLKHERAIFDCNMCEKKLRSKAGLVKHLKQCGKNTAKVETIEQESSAVLK